MSKKLKILCALVCTALLLLSMCFSASAVFLEGAELGIMPRSSFESVPIRLNGVAAGEALKLGGTSYVSIPHFCETLMGGECRLRYDSESATLLVNASGIEFSIDLSDHYISINGRYIVLDNSPINVDGSIYIPIRPLAKAFAAELKWISDSDNPCISLGHSPGALIAPGSGFYNEEDLYWLSRVISSEAGNQPMEGMVAVGNVVLNRAKPENSSFPDTVQGVIFQPGQFSVVDSGAIFMEPRDRAMVAAKLCLEGFNTAGDSLFFLNPQLSDSSWFDSFRVFRLSIGEHHFYA